MERDEGLRATCFLSLDALRAQFGDELPYPGVLDRGFRFAGHPRIPFLNRQKGIYRAAAQRGHAALSVVTAFDGPYRDRVTPEGFLYAFRAGSPDQYDNRALRFAHDLLVPIVYFIATRPGFYEAYYPFFVQEVRLSEHEVLLSPGIVDPTLPVPEAVPLEDTLTRRYQTRQVLARVHQGRFRALVLPAYRERCAICRLREARLLDAAHIIPDRDHSGEPAITNGLSLCSIHHRAFDHHLVGVSPDYEVRVSRRLLEDDDGPMLDLLKGFHARPIELPRAPRARPDRDRLAARYDEFLARS